MPSSRDVHPVEQATRRLTRAVRIGEDRPRIGRDDVAPRRDVRAVDVEDGLRGAVERPGAPQVAVTWSRSGGHHPLQLRGHATVEHDAAVLGELLLDRGVRPRSHVRMRHPDPARYPGCVACPDERRRSAPEGSRRFHARSGRNVRDDVLDAGDPARALSGLRRSPSRAGLTVSCVVLAVAIGGFGGGRSRTGSGRPRSIRLASLLLGCPRSALRSRRPSRHCSSAGRSRASACRVS